MTITAPTPDIMSGPEYHSIPNKIEQGTCRRFTIGALQSSEGLMTSDPLAAFPIGRKVTVSKTVSESDVYLFAGITGDFSRNHTDEAYMRKTRYGRRIAHGALAVGFMSNASTKILDGVEGTWVSYGYDRVRFPAPLFFGDTIIVEYEVAERDPAAKKVFSRVTVTTDSGSVVAAATHILKRVD
jgi:acyl dehydratase